ncbi:MAG: hypothetical protein ACYTGC_00215 [Planctomycetota bacterium]|jgi:hypothetical protein
MLSIKGWIPRCLVLGWLLTLLPAHQASAQSGACCLPSGACVEVDPFSCAALGGLQAGAGLSCSSCASITGACCLSNGCKLLRTSDSAQCPVIGGTWRGTGSTCVDCNPLPEACGDPGAGSCFAPHESLGCNEEICCGLVCAIDPFCCSTIWDDQCVGVATSFCGTPPNAEDAMLQGLEVRKGIRLSGDLESLAERDGDRLRTRSELQPADSPRHESELRVTMRTTVTDVSRIDITTVTGADNAGSETFIFLRNFDEGRWDRIDRFAQPTADTERANLGIPDAASYVKSNGRILVRILARRTATFRAKTNLVRVSVTPAE